MHAGQPGHEIPAGRSPSEVLAALRERLDAGQLVADGIEDFLGWHVRINDGPNYYHMYKDLAVQRIYDFEASRPDPLILDCGSNIGLSVLYFLRRYPQARITAFEPDRLVQRYLCENLRRNDIHSVRIVPAAVGPQACTVRFRGDGKYAGAVVGAGGPGAGPRPGGGTGSVYAVECVRLRDYLTEPVDFLKMNIEGAEWEVLSDCAPLLHRVEQMVVEYHHLPGLPRTLHEILGLLHGCQFDYLLNHFDYETNPAVRPPFRLHHGTRYFLLIYARRRGAGR